MAKKHLLSSFVLSVTDDEDPKDYFAQPKLQNGQENENTLAINPNQSGKLEKNETNEENQEPLAHAKPILSEFKAALH